MNDFYFLFIFVIYVLVKLTFFCIMEQNDKGKSWLYRLKYLKMWKTNSQRDTSTSGMAPLSNQRVSSNFSELQSFGRNENAASFRRNLTTNSLDGRHTELTGTGSHLRKSFRKWHRRMKNCFSKSSRHMRERQTIHISPAPASSNSSRITLATQSCGKENIYSLDPHTQFQQKSRSPVSDRTPSDVSALSPRSLSRFTTQSDNIPTPPPRTIDRDRPALNRRSSLRGLAIGQSSLGSTPHSQSPLRGSPIGQRSLGASPLAQSSPQTERMPSPDVGNGPTNEVASLAYCTWYWGPASRSVVEKKLSGAPDGSFLVRDSTSDRYIFSISFRSVGVTLHSRIDYTSRNGYKLFDHEGYSSVKALIEQAMEVSKNTIYCYTKNRGDVSPNYPVRLTRPVCRYDKVRSLQNLARFVIRQNVNLNDIDKLGLPGTLVGYLKEETIF